MAADHTSPSESNASGLPDSFGRFRILRLLGQGGMGLVYLADDPKKDRQIALKVLAQEKADNPTLLKRFRSEALATRELKHENIVGVYEAGSIGGQFYIALEFVDGTDVAQLIQSRGRLPLRRSLDITHQVALALSVAHQRNIVHRDIKPSNLLIRRDGMVKLTDMGLARTLDESDEAGITRAGTTVGTVDYIAPEQARDSKAADTRSDIYSLGCTWYHMLTGQVPFPDGSLTDKLRKHAATAAPDPRSIDDSIPEGVVLVLQQMLEKLPERRYQDPDELAEALSAINLDRTELSADIIAALADDDPDSEPPPPPSKQSVSRPPRRDSTTSSTEPSGTNTPGDHPVPKTVDTVPLIPIDDPDTDGRASVPTPTHPRKRPPPAAAPAPAPAPEAPDSAPAAARARPTPPTTPPSPAGGNPSQSPAFRRRPSSTPTVTPPSPRSRRPARRASREDTDDDQGIDWNKLKPLGLTAVGAILLSLFGYILVNLSQSIDMSDKQGSGNLFGSTDDATSNAGAGGHTSAAGTKASGADNDPHGATVNEPVFETRPAPVLVGKPATPPSKPPPLRQGEQRFLFDWAKQPPGDKLPVLVVAGGQVGPGHFHSLDAALSAITDRGGWIQLRGPGPFFITATELVDRGHVVISAPKSTRAVVVLRTSSLRETPGSILRLRDTSLDLRRIDLSPAKAAFPGNSHLTFISCQASHLSLVDCSITQPQRREGRTTAVSVSSSSGTHANRILFDRVLARGVNTSFLEINSRFTDVSLINSLLVTDSASPIRIQTPGGKTSANDRRRLRLLSCTLCSGAPLLELDSGASGGTIPETQVAVVNSLLACPSTGDRVLLNLGRWPQQTDAASANRRFQALDWEQHGSVSRGVREFIRRDADIGLSITTFSEWQACWKTPGEDTAFVSTPWNSFKVKADLVSPTHFDSGRSGDQLPPATDGTPPGCRVLGLKEADTRVVALALGQVGRPAWIPKQPRPRPFLSLQMADHPDLGQFLSKHPPPAGAVIVVEGSGLCTTSPIVVGAGGLKLVFRDAERGPPLILAPHPSTPAQPHVASATPTPSTPSTAVNAPTALFNLNGGLLELVGGRFQLPQSDGPAWLLKVNDGHFAIQDCSLLGPLGSSRTERGLIDWSGIAPGASGRITGSYLAGGGTLLKADFRGRSLLVHDSLLFSTGSIFDLNLGRCDTPAHSDLDIRSSSLSAAKFVFQVRSQQASNQAEPTTGDATALDLFVDQTIFARGVAPDSTGKAQAILLSCSFGLLTDHMVRWWGTRNGFSPALTTYLADRNGDGLTGQNGTLSDFNTFFPAPSRIRALHEKTGFLSGKTLPEVTRVRPQHFRLDRASRGRTWGPKSRPIIGSDVDRLEAQLGDAAARPAGKIGGKPDF